MNSAVFCCRLTGFYTAAFVALPLLACPVLARHSAYLVTVIGPDMVSAISTPGARMFLQALGLIQGLNAFVLVTSSGTSALLRPILFVNSAGRLLFAGLATYYGLVDIALGVIWIPTVIDGVIGLTMGIVASQLS